MVAKLKLYPHAVFICILVIDSNGSIGNVTNIENLKSCSWQLDDLQIIHIQQMSLSTWSNMMVENERITMQIYAISVLVNCNLLCMQLRFFVYMLKGSLTLFMTLAHAYPMTAIRRKLNYWTIALRKTITLYWHTHNLRHISISNKTNLCRLVLAPTTLGSTQQKLMLNCQKSPRNCDVLWQIWDDKVFFLRNLVHSQMEIIIIAFPLKSNYQLTLWHLNSP